MEKATVWFSGHWASRPNPDTFFNKAVKALREQGFNITCYGNSKKKKFITFENAQEEKVAGMNKVYLRNTHRYGFRPGECAEILGVVSFTPDGSDARACYHIEYADGIKDHVAIDDSGYYELEMMI